MTSNLDWIPDWRDKSQYPHPKDLTLKEWAWQFLRRNRQYQADYAQWESQLKQSIANPGDLVVFTNGKRNDISEISISEGARHKALKKIVGSDYPALLLLANKYTHTYRYLDGAGATPHVGEGEWSTIGPVPPDQERFPGIFFTEQMQYVDGLTNKGVGDLWTFRPSKYEALIRFDLRRSISKEIDDAEKLLSRLKKQAKKELRFSNIIVKNRIDNFPRYIRVLDSEIEKADRQDLAEILLMDHDVTQAMKIIDKWKSTARSYRNEKYDVICMGSQEYLNMGSG